MTDREILRPLAYAYAQASQSSQNDRRRLLHRKVNDLEMERPVVLINELPWNQLNFDGSLTLRCQDPLFRGAEDFFRKKLFQWTHFPGDMILTPYFPVMKRFTRTGIGIRVEEAVLEEDKGNNIVAHEYHDQLETEEQLEKIRLPVLSYQEEATWEEFGRLGEVFGDLLPVRITGHNSYFSMWDNISQYRGVTPLLIDLAERPEFTHRIIRKFTDIELSVSEQMEKLGLFEPNPIEIHCTCALNSTLPGESDGGPAKRSQVWGRGMAQIFSSVSAAMHEEFDIQYMKEVMEPFGLTYYGCCEPLDRKIHILEKLPHLRKISITPWADAQVAAQAIGKKYVLSAKPNPAAVAVQLDRDALKKELGYILSACKENGCSCELVLKDISSVNYRLENIVGWERTAMEMVQSW